MRPEPESQGILKAWHGNVDANFRLPLLDHGTGRDYRWLKWLPENWNLAKVCGFGVNGLHCYWTAAETVWCVSPHLSAAAAGFSLWMVGAVSVV